MRDIPHCNLKEILEKEGISQIDLSGSIKTAYGTINKTCNNRYNPAPTLKNKILKGVNKLSDRIYTLEEIFPNTDK